MAINNEKISSVFLKILLLAILVGFYFAYALVPHYINNYSIKQKCIVVYKQKDMALPSFTADRKAKLIKHLSEEIAQEYDIHIKPKDIVFKTTKNETYLSLNYNIKAELPFAAKINEILNRCEEVNGKIDCGGYLERHFEIFIEGNQ